MIINGKALLDLKPIKNMETEKKKFQGASYGLSEAGYDIRLKQEVIFDAYDSHCRSATCTVDGYRQQANRFCIASAIEEFQMPCNLIGVVHDKSTWARKCLSVFNTVIEPGWNGFLTLELVYHSGGILKLPAGVGIAQVIFSETISNANYSGKYQNQANKPISAILE